MADLDPTTIQATAAAHVAACDAFDANPTVDENDDSPLLDEVMATNHAFVAATGLSFAAEAYDVAAVLAEVIPATDVTAERDTLAKWVAEGSHFVGSRLPLTIRTLPSVTKAIEDLNRG